MTDLDWTALEYDLRVPKALVEYKYGLNWQVLARDTSNLAALSDLATGYRNCGSDTCGACGSGIPFVIVRYLRDPWRFKIERRNGAAMSKIPASGCDIILPEFRYVTFLYWLADRKVPDDIAPGLER